MNAKTTKVMLNCDSLGSRLFEIGHAERILRMVNNGGWKLADDNYKFEDGYIVRRHKEEDSGRKKKVNNK